ncbi:hypothetical protein Tco_0552509, partial [Tanacetum coccineum]
FWDNLVTWELEADSRAATCPSRATFFALTSSSSQPWQPPRLQHWQFGHGDGWPPRPQLPSGQVEPSG